MKRVMIVGIVMMSLVSGCSTTTKATRLSDEGKLVRVLESKTASGCDVVGKVVGENDFGSVDVARVDARNKAAKLGGNAIFVTEEIMNGSDFKVHATAYECH